MPTFAANVCRLHDRGRTWKLAELSLALALTTFVVGAAAGQSRYTAVADILLQLGRAVTVVNFILSIYLFVQFVQRGDVGPNEYGPDPLDNPAPAPSFSQLTASVQPRTQGAPSTTAREANSSTTDTLARLSAWPVFATPVR